MRRTILTLLLLLCIGCAMTISRPGTITVYAQTLPITKTVFWNPNASIDNVTTYTLVLDATAPVQIAPASCSAECSRLVTFTTAGTHTLTLTATNQWAVSGPTTLTVTVQVPAAPGGMRIQ
jgi:hypothetical protein